MHTGAGRAQMNRESKYLRLGVHIYLFDLGMEASVRGFDP
jgi:hypothetical protein